MLVGATALLAGCVVDTGSSVPRAQVPWGSTLDLACANGQTMKVQFGPDQPVARVTLDGGQTAVLRQVGAANDAKFTDGATTLYIQGDVAALEVTGQVVRRACRAR